MSQPMRAEAVTAVHDAQAVDVIALTKEDTEVAVTPITPIKKDEPVVTRRVCLVRYSISGPR